MIGIAESYEVLSAFVLSAGFKGVGRLSDTWQVEEG
jgi:hypothetical protein